ncbi:hypothetical protein BDV98DRAFT_652817 [Pterulicium gracile]|uniref:Uncharacterized protein n=1 Tax=Pterulicium gracile TaxID=1884261 RepID=A0A5C3QVZ8_9AGAR|nr:hypothetical protein BDV98DRAFT_652817 [Pterula gracilis]
MVSATVANKIAAAHVYASTDMSELDTYERAVRLQNASIQAESSGDYQRAEECYLQAIRIKEAQAGLGELYMRIGRLDEAAETNSVFAVEVRDNTEPHLDAAVSRENLGQLYEMKVSRTLVPSWYIAKVWPLQVHILLL